MGEWQPALKAPTRFSRGSERSHRCVAQHLCRTCCSQTPFWQRLPQSPGGTHAHCNGASQPRFSFLRARATWAWHCERTEPMERRLTGELWATDLNGNIFTDMLCWATINFSSCPMTLNSTNSKHQDQDNKSFLGWSLDLRTYTLPQKKQSLSKLPREDRVHRIPWPLIIPTHTATYPSYGPYGPSVASNPPCADCSCKPTSCCKLKTMYCSGTRVSSKFQRLRLSMYFINA